MISTVYFYRMKGSLSSGEYPLLSENQDLSSFLLSSVSKKVTADILTGINVPSFTGYETANVAKIGSNFYWITGYQQSTIFNGTIDFRLSIMPPTTLLRKNDTLTAYFERSPTYITKYLHDDFTGGVVGMSDIKPIGNVIVNANDTSEALYWVQITGLYEHGGGNEIVRFGCFVTVDKGEAFSDVYLDYRVIYGDPDSLEMYPSLATIINQIESITPFTGNNTVLDVSISRRCPYAYKVTHVTGGTAPYTVYDRIVLKDSSNNDILPGNGTGIGASADLYWIDNYLNLDKLVTEAGTATYTLDDYDRMCGSFGIKDWNRNLVMTFPVAESNTITYQTYADLSGIYTIIDNGHRRITLPEGKLPWDGSSWSDYVAYSMDADREAAYNSQQYALYQYETDKQKILGNLIAGGTTNIIGGALLTGNAAGAVMGAIGSAGGAVVDSMALERDLTLQYRQIYDDYMLAQKKAQLAAGSAYNVGYGLIYVALTCQDNDLQIGLLAPMENGSDLMTAYTARYGYPCEGSQTITVGTGFYKGIIPATSTLNGVIFDLLNANMRTGFRFVDP